MLLCGDYLNPVEYEADSAKVKIRVVCLLRGGHQLNEHVGVCRNDDADS